MHRWGATSLGIVLAVMLAQAGCLPAIQGATPAVTREVVATSSLATVATQPVSPTPNVATPSSDEVDMHMENVEATPSSREALIIVEGPDPDAVLARVSEFVRVTQRLPPRLAIVTGEGDQLDAVRNLPRVIGVFEGAVPEPTIEQLNPTERLFAEAWAVGRQPKPFRPGEGLPWDAEGFEAP